MALLHCGLVLAAATSALVPSHGTEGTATRLKRVQAPKYSAQQVEAYLEAEQIEYIRPGLNATLTSIQIPEDRRPVLEITFTDDFDQPLDREGKVTPGAISASFILARYDAPNRDYIGYTTRTQTSPITGDSAVQVSSDSGGQWTPLGNGAYRYRFGRTLPAGFPTNATHTLGMYASRNLNDIIEKTYYANLLHDFRPDGAAVTEVWDAFDTATCNSCHDPLALHGGSRREVKLCVLCHNATQSTDPDTGNTVEMRSMIHKIHNAHNLANGYTIIGYNQSVHDYSHVTYPQDVRNCETCHRESSAEGYIWFANPTRVACGSCHDDIDWATGEGHIAGPQFDDDDCASCHQPVGESEFDVSIMGAHTIPTKSQQLPGLVLEVLSVSDTAPGDNPTVVYTLKDYAGTLVAPASLSSFNFLVGGPTTDYAEYFREDPRNGSTCTASSCSYTFTRTIPADAEGTWTISADYYKNVTIDDHSESGLSVRDAGFNPIFDFAVTDLQPMARREIVSLDKCNQCHETLALHGGQRYRVEECVICHNPNETDAAVRPASAGAAEGIHLKWLAHRLHSGLELTRDFTVYGYRSSVHNYNEVTYPGDRRNCQACHQAGTYGVPLPDGALPTTTPRDFVPEWHPQAASCLSCHDTQDAAAHAYVNTAPFGEACASCHGSAREFSVDKVHAR